MHGGDNVKLTYIRKHQLTRLHLELLSLPFLQPVIRSNGEHEAVFILCGDGQTIYLDVPDLTPEQITAIDQVINNHYPDLTVSTSPNPAAVSETVIVMAILPDGAPDTEVMFQLEGGRPYTEPVTDGKASHAYAFTMSGTYRINVSSAKCGTATVEVVVQ
jgi:hypothetical protein